MKFDTRLQTPDYQYVKELFLPVYAITGKRMKALNPALTTFNIKSMYQSPSVPGRQSPFQSIFPDGF